MNILELQNRLNKFNLNLSNRDVCQIINMAEESFSRKKKAGTDLKQSDIEKIEKKFNIKLINDYELSNNVLTLEPIIASCGNGLTIDTALLSQYDTNSQYFFIVVKGDSMEPTINNKDICIVRKYDGNFVDGIYCFSYGDDIFIKRL